MEKYVEIDMSNSEDIKEGSQMIGFLIEKGYEITLIRKIGDKECYGVHLRK